MLLISLSSQASLVWGHGRLIEPAARNAAWRYGFDVPPNFDENQQNCGGVGVQWGTNGGKCGVCGDPYNGPQPHVHPGKYATGVITKTYTSGQTIQVKIAITANHFGWFEFRLGKLVEPPITQSKLTHLLKLTNGQTRWYLESDENKEYTIDVKLPDGVSCDHCVLQWWWNSGNSWGCDENSGMCGIGYGPQETYSNCADIKVMSTGDETGGGTNPNTEAVAQTTTPTTPAETLTSPDSEEETETNEHTISTTVPGHAVACHAVGPWEGNLEMDKWCYDNCSQGYCPSSHCECA